MDIENTEIKISKFLCLVLRHKPETIGLDLDKNGWADVQSLIKKMNSKGFSINIDLLKHIVETNPKKRFAFSYTFDKIRANQGHSIEVELGYKSQIPPNILYHGTGQKSVNSIFEKGIQKRDRHHVHLSADVHTAINVGSRHGKPFVFEVLASQMHDDKYIFFLSDNGVWLTDFVPVKYLKKQD